MVQLPRIAGADEDGLEEAEDPAAAAARRLGIPERELSPRVRAGVAALGGEITRLKRELETLRAQLQETERAANQDTLLPLLNRRAFVREVSRFIAFVERYGTPASLIYFDLDGFKAINDVYGHAAGDAVLQHFAGTLISHVRGTDVVGRLGGDEFCIILAHANLNQARGKGISLIDALHGNPPCWEGHPVPISFSFGAYELRAGESPDAAIAAADQAMYAHKRTLKQ